MTPQHVISQLLETDTQYHQHLDLLKKIILVTYLGRLQINGLSPDNTIPLANYLFDNERTMIDLTRLTEAKILLFKQWLLDPHQAEKINKVGTVSTNEHRGFTAECPLGWWSSTATDFEYWKIANLNSSSNYQLTGIELCHGKQGILIGFDQLMVPLTGNKYSGADNIENEPLGNTKRIFITDILVDKMCHINVKNMNFAELCKRPHPLSIHVTSIEQRLKKMHDYRVMQQYIKPKTWYSSMGEWTKSWFVANTNATKEREEKSVGNPLVLLYENAATKIYQRAVSQEIIVHEAKEYKNLVLCGGGAKLFAHIGVWKALQEAGIQFERFSGSSAGAIICLLCYLGYTAEQMLALFKPFKQEHLIYFNIDFNGLSDPDSLKTALDYAIASKIEHIVSQYNIPYPEGKITFKTLDTLKNQCPGCGIGANNELIVTGTNKELRSTTYFSLAKSPLMEVSEAVKISASFPLLYRDTSINGMKHNDGGILNNFPTNPFSDEHTTLLESEHGTNLELLAVQFDNGTERNTIDSRAKVYREDFISNWFYSQITGVADPASGWEEDRRKLRKYASQAIIVDVGTVSSTGFGISEEEKNKLVHSGYDAAKNYLELRYEKTEDNQYLNRELMYSSFTCLGELLAYCCYRDNPVWFEIVVDLIKQSAVTNRKGLLKQAKELKNLYFNSIADCDIKLPFIEHSLTFFGNQVPQAVQEKYDKPAEHNENYRIFLRLYPIFLKLTPQLLSNKAERHYLELARHSLTIHSPFDCLEHFKKIKGEVHIVLHIVVGLIQELQKHAHDAIYESLSDVKRLLHSDLDIFKQECTAYYADWNLSINQNIRLLRLLNSDEKSVLHLISYLRRNYEPMQTIQKGVYKDDLTAPFDACEPQCVFR